MAGRSTILQPLLRITAIAMATVLFLSVIVLSFFYAQVLAKLDDMNDFDLNFLITSGAEDGTRGITQAIATLTTFDYAERPKLFVEYLQDKQVFDGQIYGLDAMQSERGFIKIKDSAFRARAMSLAENEYLIVGRDTATMWQQMALLSALILLTAVLASLLCFIYLQSYQRRQTQRIHQIVQAVDETGRGKFDINVPQSGKNDELDQIASAIAFMARNIQSRIEEHQRFSDQLAHELRMPLARLSASLHTNEHNGLDTDFVNARILEVSNTLQDILELSAIRNEKDAKMQPETGFVSGFIDDTWQLFEDIAQDRRLNVVIETDQSYQAELNPTLFRRLLVNLMDNALSHTPEEGQITLASNAANNMIFSVENTGSAFPDAIAGQSQIPAYATNKFDGHGKGLAFVYAIADYHGWQVTLSNTPQGARVTVSSLPKSTTALQS